MSNLSPRGEQQDDIQGALLDSLEKLPPNPNSALVKKGATEMGQFLLNIDQVKIVNDTYQILLTDATIIGNKISPFVITLPMAIVGQTFNIKNIGSGNITLDGYTTDLIDGQLTQPLSRGSAITVQCPSANTWVII